MNSNHTCDVNVIFSYITENQFKRKVDDYIKANKNNTLICLRAVKDTFIATFSEKLKTAGDIIREAVNKTNEEVEKRNQRLRPSELVENTFFNKNFKEAIRLF